MESRRGDRSRKRLPRAHGGEPAKRATMADFFGGKVTHLPLRHSLTLEVLPEAVKPEEQTPVEKKLEKKPEAAPPKASEKAPEKAPAGKPAAAAKK